MHRGGASSDDFEGAYLVEKRFLFEDFVVGAFAQSLSGCGGCIVYSYPAIGYVFGSVEKHVREFRIAPVYASNCEGALRI